MAAALALTDDEIFIPLTRGNLMFFLVEIANMVWTCVFDSSDLYNQWKSIDQWLYANLYHNTRGCFYYFDLNKYVYNLVWGDLSKHNLVLVFWKSFRDSFCKLSFFRGNLHPHCWSRSIFWTCNSLSLLAIYKVLYMACH